ncbi:glycosyltransferase [Carboxydochorda subterranea]|uniref:Glycosyltransferase n=1 Tax=Carboxydichorda subterranea TaxID=3109565 RepID=A0ABZ1BUM4_9FIRM|nr:glycosyltransferase [Limnochorda sp. L945t]WRP16190.1 glycosyltransferase [Limnochorda sp. L945t]
MMEDVCRISACIIARDEEPFIGNCLRSLQGAVDEVIVVDTGSTDRTPEIANALGARVIYRQWPDHFAAARNWALEVATGQWVFIIDADEELVEGSAEVLVATAMSGRADGYLVNIHHFPEDEDAHLVSQRLSLFRNDPRYRFEGRIHEQISGPLREKEFGVLPSRIEVVHRGYEPWLVAGKQKHNRNLELLRQELQAAPLEPRWHYYLGQEYQALGRFEEAAQYYERTLELLERESRHTLIVPAALRLILVYARLGRWEEFFRTSDRYRAAYPACTDLYFVDAQASMDLGDFRRALLMLLDAVSKGDPAPGTFQIMLSGTGSYRAWFQLGRVLQSMGQRKEAVGAYLQALHSRPSFRSAARALATLLLSSDPVDDVVSFVLDHVANRHPAMLVAISEVLLQAGAYSKALDVLDQIDDKARLERALRKGIVLAALGEVDKARANLTEALKGEVVRDRIALDGAIAAVSLGDHRLAGQLVARMHPARFAAGIQVLQGIGCGGREQVVDSMLGAQLTADVAERVAAAWQLVDRSLALAQFRATDRLVEYILRQGVSRFEAGLTLGKLLFAYGNKPAAVELLLDAAKHGNVDAKSAAILAQAALEREDWDSAEELLRYAAELDKADHGIAAALASLLAERGRVREAIDLLDERIALLPWAARLREQRDRLAARLAPIESVHGGN